MSTSILNMKLPLWLNETQTSGYPPDGNTSNTLDSLIASDSGTLDTNIEATTTAAAGDFLWQNSSSISQLVSATNGITSDVESTSYKSPSIAAQSQLQSTSYTPLEDMILPVNTTLAPVLEDVTTSEPPSGDLKPIHIHFLIVGVLFIVVLIMLGLHNYIEMLTDGGKKSIPAFAGGGDNKGKPRATLRPVIRSKSGNKGSSKL